MARSVVKVETPDLIIEVDQTKCISCGTCAALAPETFELNDEMVGQVKSNPNGTTEIIVTAAQSCSGAAISVTDKKTGQKLYPKS